ncbi:MAG: biotin/lipoyl-binding protein [Chloroflexota bacterium]
MTIDVVKSKWLSGSKVFLPIALFAVLFLAACTSQPAAVPGQSGEPVEAFIGNLEANATASGSLVPSRSAVLNAPSAGLVDVVSVRPGQAVSAGDPLVTLDTFNLELNRQSAEQDVRQAEANLADLMAAPTVAELAAAEAAVAGARLNWMICKPDRRNRTGVAGSQCAQRRSCGRLGQC